MPLYTQFTKTNRKPDQEPGVGVQSLLQWPIDSQLSSILLNNSLISDDLASAVFSGKIVETMDGAASVELNVLDSKRVFIKDLLGDWLSHGPAPVYTVKTGKTTKKVIMPSNWNDIYLTLDGRDFCLCGVHKQGSEFDLTFENRAVHELRRYSTQKTWQRTDTFTRAMCIKAMIDEVTTMPGGIDLFTNELRTVQPVAPADTTNTGTSPDDNNAAATKQHGFAPNAPVTVKHVKATAQQRDYIAQVLREGEAENMPYNVLVSAIMCITQESGVTLLKNPYLGMGLFSQEMYIGGQRSTWPCMTQGGIPGDAKAYFTQALKCYKNNPSQALADLVQCVQRSGAGASYYAQWESEAKNTLSLWGTSDVSGVDGGTATATFSQVDPYLFRRGTDQGAEDSWTCMQRLSQEVNWRCWMVDNTLYYENDNTLAASIPYATISEQTDGIEAIDYDVDTGKTVSECTVTAQVLRWEARPGSCIVIENEGIVDGRWIIWQTEHVLGLNTATITLRLPVAPLKEPAPTTSQVTVTGESYLNGGVTSTGNSVVDKAYAMAKQISDKQMPYVYAGGHNADFSPAGGGYDCSGYVSACLHAAGVLATAMASGGLNGWGQPGRGSRMTVWTNPNPGPSGHAFIEFNLPSPQGHCQANTSHVKPPNWGAAVVPWGGPGLSDSNSSAFYPRHWPGT
jgi:hypothetical protein